jgi:hypothetical protein
MLFHDTYQLQSFCNVGKRKKTVTFGDMYWPNEGYVWKRLKESTEISVTTVNTTNEICIRNFINTNYEQYIYKLILK